MSDPVLNGSSVAPLSSLNKTHRAERDVSTINIRVFDDSDLPKSITSVLHKAVVAFRRGDQEASEHYAKIVLETEPNHVEALYLLGILLTNQGRYDEGVSLLAQVCTTQPDFDEAKSTFMIALGLSGAHEEAAELSSLITQGDNMSPEALFVRGLALEANGKFPEACACYEAILSIKPDFLQASIKLGQLLLRSGTPDKAIDILTPVAQNLSTDPRDIANGSADLLLRSIYRDPSLSLDKVIDAHFAWGVRHANPLSVDLPQVKHDANPNRANPNRPLRIGLLASGHPASPFAGAALSLAGGLGGEDTSLTPILYTCNGLQTSANIQTHIIDSLSNPQLARQICADQIDVLIDFIGHEVGGRQGALAYDPAPVQLTYGLPSGGRDLAGCLMDSCLYPESVRTLSMPQTVRMLPGSLMQVCPFDDSLPLMSEREKRERNASPIICCFGDGTCLTKDAINLWIEILRRIPEGRMGFSNQELTDLLIRKYVIDTFAQRGIPEQRLLLDGPFAPDRLPAIYGVIDVMLDSFPFSNPGLASQALAMGVPIITLTNNAPWNRTTASLLEALGLEEFIAENPEEYIALIVSLATDPGRLDDYRQTLRDQLYTGQTRQTETLCRTVSQAVRDIWQEWCVKEKEDLDKQNPS